MGRKDVDVLAGNLDWWVSKRKRRDGPAQERTPRMALRDGEEDARVSLSAAQLDYLDGLMWSMTITPEKGHDFHIFHATPDDIEDAIPLRFTDEEVKEKIRGNGRGDHGLRPRARPLRPRGGRPGRSSAPPRWA